MVYSWYILFKTFQNILVYWVFSSSRASRPLGLLCFSHLGGYRETPQSRKRKPMRKGKKRPAKDKVLCINFQQNRPWYVYICFLLKNTVTISCFTMHHTVHLWTQTLWSQFEIKNLNVKPPDVTVIITYTFPCWKLAYIFLLHEHFRQKSYMYNHLHCTEDQLAIYQVHILSKLSCTFIIVKPWN